MRKVVVGIAVAWLVGSLAGGHGASAKQAVPASSTQRAVASGRASAQSHAVAMAIAYARQQLGKPYLWGGTGPSSYDCSGLVMMAYRAAGIDMPRTSEEQWAWGPRVAARQVQPGDLVFFVGADGTWAAPGHVGLVIGQNLMIEAYGTGFPIRISHFGTVESPPGDEVPVGFIRPSAHEGIS